jgi:3-dehydroquinate dehydratase/shikimate dehydrogenase
VTRLCVAIFVRSSPDQPFNDLSGARADIARCEESGADLLELRVDELRDASEIAELVKTAHVATIITCRPSWEGGFCDLPEPQRIELLKQATVTHTGYIDIELASNRVSAFTTSSRESRPGVIVSSHDFTGRPARLTNIVQELNDSPADVAKIVWTARTIRDNLEAFEILQHKQKPTIALCMGEAGLISRVLAKKFGAFLTFASLDASGGTASGQIPVADMKRLYRWDAIDADTKVYGVVANPVAHSMSPAIHNAAFDRVGHNGVYLPLLVDSSYESFKAFMESFLHFPGLHLSGLSITLPHKENALRYLQERNAEVEELAVRIGAVNTIAIEEGGNLRGFNTDYAAILNCITDKLHITREQLADHRVAVIGAGGTGRTAVAALAHFGATVVIYNRTKERADALAAEFNGHRGKVVSARMEKICDTCCQIYINTTSVGMHPNVDESPLGNEPPKFGPDTLVFDAIYNPMKTKLLQQAEAAGAKTIGGVEMFVRQAAGQFAAWTGKPAPTDVMRQVVEGRLAPSS